MTSYLVLSDSHGNRSVLDALDGVIGEQDGVIHLGDLSGDGGYVLKKHPEKQVILINGNCDPMKLGSDEEVLEVEGVRIFMTHGHLYGVKYALDKLAYRAKELNCTVALYGHTHEAREEDVGGVLTFNPGCLTRYSRKSYGYLCIHQGKAVVKIVPLD